MTYSESIKICNTIGFATSFSNPKWIPLNTTKEELAEAMRMAIQALEKQIPMKVLHSYDDSVDENWCSCHICCSGLGWEHGKHYKYCMNCGKKLDWS